MQRDLSSQSVSVMQTEELGCKIYCQNQVFLILDDQEGQIYTEKVGVCVWGGGGGVTLTF